MAKERSLGAFNNDLRDAIAREIRQLAVYHNRHTQIRDIPADDLCEILIEPHRRDFARDAAVTYGGNMFADLFVVEIPMDRKPIDIGLEACVTPAPTRFGTTRLGLNLNWATAKPFARHTLEAKRFYTDSRPDLVARLEEMTVEWVRTGLEYEFAAQVFLWVNKFCNTNDKAHARHLLPGIVPLINRIAEKWVGENETAAAKLHQLAGQLQGAKYPCGRKPVPVEMVEALKHANHLIAGALLLGKVERVFPPEGMATIELAGEPSYIHPLYPEILCQPILKLSDLT